MKLKKTQFIPLFINLQLTLFELGLYLNLFRIVKHIVKCNLLSLAPICSTLRSNLFKKPISYLILFLLLLRTERTKIQVHKVPCILQTQSKAKDPHKFDFDSQKNWPLYLHNIQALDPRIHHLQNIVKFTIPGTCYIIYVMWAKNLSYDVIAAYHVFIVPSWQIGPSLLSCSPPELFVIHTLYACHICCFPCKVCQINKSREVIINLHTTIIKILNIHSLN